MVVEPFGDVWMRRGDCWRVGWRFLEKTTPIKVARDFPQKQVQKPCTRKTLGGRQFWGDVHYFRGWRIQQNVFTKHYRLLDPGDSDIPLVRSKNAARR